MKNTANFTSILLNPVAEMRHHLLQGIALISEGFKMGVCVFKTFFHLLTHGAELLHYESR